MRFIPALAALALALGACSSPDGPAEIEAILGQPIQSPVEPAPIAAIDTVDPAVALIDSSLPLGVAAIDSADPSVAAIDTTNPTGVAAIDTADTGIAAVDSTDPGDIAVIDSELPPLGELPDDLPGPLPELPDLDDE